MASKQPSTTTQVQKIELPKWVDEASQENFALAKELGTAEFNPYKGDRVADTSAATKAAYDYFNKNVGSAGKGYGTAQGIFGNINTEANALNPTAVKAGMLKDADLSAYMNPYVDNVETKALDALDRSRQQSVMSNASAAAGAKAFGGSRHGIVDAVTNSEAAREAGNLSAGLRKDAYDSAVAGATGDINRQFSADQLNQKNILDTFLARTGAKGQAAQGYMSAAQGSQAAKMQDFAGLMQMGQQQQAQSQAEIDALREKHDEKRNYDLENLNLRLSALGMSPYGKTETTQKTTQGGSSGTDFGQLGLGIFSLLLGLSEDDTKTDKEKVGKVPGTDLDLWAYRYKSDPKTYPKVVGVMASDVEKKMPEAVHKVDGKRVINYGMIGEALANG